MKLNTNIQTLLVSFINGEKTICQGKGFLETLKEKEGRILIENEIESIKIFDPKNAKFKKVSKKFVQSLFDWETETAIYLNTHYFFKNA